MTILTVALKYLRGRFVASALTAISLTLGVSLVIASVLLTRGIKEGFTEGTTDYSLVVGAKGSPTQLVLNVVFRMDVPTPNILYGTYRQVRDDPRVEVAVPVALEETRIRDFASWRRPAHTSRPFHGVARSSKCPGGGSSATIPPSGRPTRRCSALKRRAEQACGSAIASTRARSSLRRDVWRTATR